MRLAAVSLRVDCAAPSMYKWSVTHLFRAATVATVLLDEQCTIPGDLATLADFRRWTQSVEFPATGRIDWVASRIEVDMSPEDIFTHGTLKTAIVARLWPLANERGMHLFTGETRVSSPTANLSVEPDVVAVSEAAFEAGGVRLVPSAGGQPDRFVELEGGPDLVVEIVSDSSVAKDTRRLPAAYHAAGVKEFWLVDARGAAISFQILRHGPSGYVEARTPGGMPWSTIFNCSFTIERSRNPQGRFVYDVVARPGA